MTFTAAVAFVLITAISVVLVLVVVRMLDYPFAGALALSNSDFARAIEHVTPML